MKPDVMIYATLDKLCKKVGFGRRCIEEMYKESAYGTAKFRDLPDFFAVTGLGMPYTGSGNNIKYHPKDMFVWIKIGDKAVLATSKNGVYEMTKDEEFKMLKEKSHASRVLTHYVTFDPDQEVLVFKGY